jgi:hypothetical protein
MASIASEPKMTERLKKWVAAPVTEEMDFVSVALTTVLIVSLAFAWTRILKALVD